jgi:hypothetical protein
LHLHLHPLKEDFNSQPRVPFESLRDREPWVYLRSQIVTSSIEGFPNIYPTCKDAPPRVINNLIKSMKILFFNVNGFVTMI